jgi:hypothetical protein
MRNEEATIVLPELEDPVCCSKVQEPNHGLPETTIGYLYEDYGMAENG